MSCPDCNRSCPRRSLCEAGEEDQLIDLGFLGGVFIAVLIACLLQSLLRLIWRLLCLPFRLVRRAGRAPR